MTGRDARERLAGLGVFPLSSAQQRLWLSDQTLPGLSAYHLVRVLDLTGPLDVDALTAALGDLVRRHEALRTSVLVAGGQPLQRVAPPGEFTLPVLAATEADDLVTAVARRPLDVAGGPLWRAELHRIGSRRHRLVLVFHHIVVDAATVTMLLTELAAGYRARLTGVPAELPTAVPYRDLVARERAADPDRDRRAGYWRRQLAGSEPLRLPTDRPRPGTPTRPGALVPVLVPAATADTLRRVARSAGGTLAQLVLAGYAVLLHRYGGRSDVVVGLPVSTRHETYGAGLYVNTLPIRVPITGNPRFGALLRQVRGTVLAALGAADVPLEQAAGPGAHYDVTFSMVPGGEPDPDLPGLATRVTHVYGGRAKFDLHLELTDAGQGTGLAGNLEYDAELFTPATGRLLVECLGRLLAGVAADPDATVGRLPLWGPMPSAPAEPGPAGRIDALFAQVARSWPERVAVLDARDGSRLTYAELAGRAGAVAGALAAAGVRRGDRVGSTLERSVDLVVAVLGVLAAGAAYVPLDRRQPAGRLAEMVGLAGVTVVLGEPLPGIDVPVLGPPAGSGSFPDGDTADDAAYVMFTSGSTGRPKAVVVPHRAVVRLVRDTDYADLTGERRWLHAAAPAFDASTLELWAPLLNGGSLVVLPGTPSVADLAATIRDNGIDSAFLTTGLFNLVVDTDVTALRPLRQVVIGGEAASPEHVRRALGVVGTVVNGYGPTENTTFTTAHRLTDPAQVTTPLPIGRPIHGTSVTVVDGYGNPVPAGVTGEIRAGGAGLAIGYAGAPALTAERFVPSPFGPPGARLYRTGDFGRLDADGVLWFAGRRDDQVKVRGFRIELGAIEQAAATHPAVAQAAVVAHADPSGDRRLVGYLVGDVDGPALNRYLADLLPAYQIPGQWLRLPALPLGPTGKVDRHALPAPDASSARPSRPNTVLEDLLVAWYTELLGVGGITQETDFFAVGGHSLLAARLAARIRAVLAVDVPLATVFANPRLADLAAAVSRLDRTDLPPLRPAGVTERLPLSPAQERLWFLRRYAPASAAYHVPIVLELTGPLDPNTLAAAVQAVVDRHPVLRTVFGEDGAGRPHQTIRPAGTPVAVRHTDYGELAGDVRAAALAQLTAAIITEPFDLAAAPPVRAALVRLAPDRHRLVLVVHHLVADGWSLPLICRDLAAAYEGALPPAGELTYGDFAVWQRDTLAGPAAERLAGYWRDRLAGVPDRLDLDADLPGGTDGEAGGIHRLTVPADLAGRVRATARQSGATLFAVLLAAFTVQLTRHTERRDLVIGTPVAGRGDLALADLVGLFVNTVPLRVDATGEPTFTELVDRVRATVVAALEHADLPFERIAALADRRNPLVRVLFAVQPTVRDHFRVGDADAELLPAHHGTAKFDLTLSLFDDDSLSGFLEYRADLFSPAYAAAFAAEFVDLLDRLTADPDLRVDAAGSPARPAEQVPVAEPGPRDEGVEAELHRLWRRVLGVPDLAADTNFFTSGGHSLTAMRVVAHVRDTLGRDVPLRDLFDHPTLAGFAARVAAAPPVSRRPALRSSAATGPAPLSAAQQRHWVLDQLEPGAATQNVPVVLRLRGPLDVPALSRALTLVAVRQAVLRTTFQTSDGVPAQRVLPPAPVDLAVTTVSDVDAAVRQEAETPFNLTAGPPWRVRLLASGPADHHLVLTLHHIICDGWSLAVLVDDLAAGYLGESDRLPPLPVQYTDYARWQQSWQQEPDDYWTRTLAGVPDLELPTDRPRPDNPAHRSGDVPVVLDPATRAALESLAATESTTLFTTVLAAFAATLGRYAGQSDFAIGTFHANRDDVATERLVGFFVNNLALRCDLSGRPTWRTLVSRLRDVVTGAYQHVATPFEQVLGDLGVARDSRRTPLFQAMCVLQNLPALPDRIGPLAVDVVRRPYERADFDLTLWLREDGTGGLCGGLTYDADLFTRQTAERLAGLFADLVRACVDLPDGMVAAAARPRPVPVSRTAIGAPLAVRFAEQAAATPDAVALVSPAGDLTYAEVAGAVERLAGVLRARGVGRESRVGVYLERSAEAVIAFLAVARAGGGYVPIDPAYPPARVAELLADAQVQMVVTREELRDEVSADVVLVDESGGAPPTAAAVAGDELAYVIFTSGSTGRPKAVEVSNANLAAYLDSIMPALALRPTDRVLAFAATTFDATTEELYPALLCGASVAPRPADVRVPDAAFDDLLAATRPTVLSLPVTFWHAWVDRLAAEHGRVPAHVRMVLLNAEEPAVRRYRQWCAAGGADVRLVNTYGPTEATVTASLYQPGPATDTHELWQRFPIGTELPGYTVHVLDPDGWPVPDGAVGELCLGGPAVTRGYRGRPATTALAYRPDPSEPGARRYHTGDLVRRLPDGTLLLLGRGDRQVKIRGHRVEPGEVEAVLLGHPDVIQAAVLATGAGEYRQLVGCVAVTDPALTEPVLRAYLADRLPQYLVPARLPILPALPLNPNGKVDRRALERRLAGDLTAPAAAPVPAGPHSAAERRLHGIWCAVLGRPDVGVHDNFFGIGGDSIRGLQVVTRARNAGLLLTVRDLFDRQTIAALAALADTRRPEPTPVAERRATGLSDSQLHGALARLRKAADR